jgi:hypothetical protein
MIKISKCFIAATMALLVGVVLSGCVSHRYRIAVNGFSDPKYADGHSYWLLSGKDGVTVDASNSVNMLPISAVVLLKPVIASLPLLTKQT